MAHKDNMMITLDEFIKRECAIWSEDYIFDLIERGYFPVLTDHGWKWMVSRVAQASSVCYDGAVAAT